MNDAKHIEMEVHTATISAPVRASSADPGDRIHTRNENRNDA